MHGPLTVTDLFPAGPLHRLGRRVDLFPELDSTNAYLLRHAADLGDGTVAAAEFQTTGRGRQGRRWLAPRGSSILLSVLLIEPAGSPRFTHAASLAATATAEAVEAGTACRPALRWPNDLVVAGKKLGGVLAESTPLPSAGQPRRALVIGIGLNCLQQPGHFQPELANNATSLEIECPQPVDRRDLARRLVQRLDARLSDQRATNDDWHWLHEAWAARCDDFGARVTLEENSRRYTGTVLEIADNGDL
ncbi:MAG: biotin--[acetyl-CoA-carboxylase] ligase, partial [Planctomycetes bacterium]|nr:biotin--[acetyl-CoA-carboxylase] ligase [Planctomycetota bacterium]